MSSSVYFVIYKGKIERFRPGNHYPTHPHDIIPTVRPFAELKLQKCVSGIVETETPNEFIHVAGSDLFATHQDALDTLDEF
jgi:hypothetical protein